MHLHDARGENDHLALGTGELAPDKYLALAKEQNCRIALETKTAEGLKQSVHWMHNQEQESEYR